MVIRPYDIDFGILKSFIVFLWGLACITLHNTVLGTADKL